MNALAGPRRLGGALRLLLRQSFARRSRLIATLASVIFPLIMMIVWDSVPTVSSEHLSQAQLYAYFGAVALSSTVTSSRATFVWGAAARTGQLESWMVLPLSPWTRTLLTDLAERAVSVLFVLPVFALLSLTFGREIDLSGLLVGVALAAGAFVLAFLINSTMGLAAIRGLRVRRLHEVFWGVGALLSGLVAPPNYLPVWLQTISDFTPYPLLVGLPASFMSGTAPPDRLPQALTSLLVWTIVAALLARVFWLRLRTIPVASVS